MMILHAKYITVYEPYPWRTMLNRHMHPALSIDLLTQGIDALTCPASLYAVCNKAGEVEEAVQCIVCFKFTCIQISVPCGVYSRTVELFVYPLHLHINLISACVIVNLLSIHVQLMLHCIVAFIYYPMTPLFTNHS